MPTLSDVASAAGLSPTTVSRYLSGSIVLPQTTRERIDAAIAALDYRPNLLAKRLSTGRAEAIGLVTPEIDNPFFAELAAAVESEAEKHGYAVSMSSTQGDPAREIGAVRRMRDGHVDGMVLIPGRPDDGTLAALLTLRRQGGAAGRRRARRRPLPGLRRKPAWRRTGHPAPDRSRSSPHRLHRRPAPSDERAGAPRRLSNTMEEAGLQAGAVFLQDYSRTFGHEAACNPGPAAAPERHIRQFRLPRHRRAQRVSAGRPRRARQTCRWSALTTCRWPNC